MPGSLESEKAFFLVYLDALLAAKHSVDAEGVQVAIWELQS